MTGRRAGVLVLLGALVGGAPTGGVGGRGAPAEGAGLPSLFPERAELTAPDGRLARLELPPEVLAACRPDLADLRIVSSAGGEVPYLVLEGLAEDEGLEVRTTARAELLGVERWTEGAERAPRAEGASPAGLPVRHERFEVAPPPPPAAAGSAGEARRWHLVVETDRRELVRQVVVSALAGEGEAGGGAPGAADRILWEGSIFRFSDPRRERLRIPLPPWPSEPLRPDRLVVHLEGEAEDFLEPAFRYEEVREIPGVRSARVELPILARRSEEDRTILEVERPRGLVPDRLVLSTGTPAFDRPVEVWDEGAGAESAPLGRGIVTRLPGPEPEGSGLEHLDVPIRPPRGNRLRVVIRDGDSPPLAALEVAATIRRPALVFALPEEGSATLYFGGGRAFRPRYDLQELAPGLPAAGEVARRAGWLHDPARLPEVVLGEARRNPRFDPSPALAFAQRPGAPLETERWEWRRRLTVRPSEEGLVQLRLGPEDLARARADLADLRIADGEGLQWPYLLQEDAAGESVAVEVEGPVTEEGVSRYELTPRHRPLGLDGISLEVDAPFVDRRFTLTADLPGSAEGETARLARGRLVLPPRDPRPLEIPFPRTRVVRLVLEVEDGSDAPLSVASASARAPVPELYFPGPAGDYDLLLGNPDARAPRYELARVRDVVLAVPAGPADAAPLEENPAYRSGARWLAGPGLQQGLLWVALLGTVAALALLTLRLVRGEGGA
ncbi:MAG: hypothetical protein ACLF0P_05495 [Thermoanaerobaculia bacterium]